MTLETHDQIIEKRRSNEKGTMMSSRGVSYDTLLGFNFETMRGKKVLDIGSSLGSNFSEEAKKYNADVVSISPDFKDKTPDNKNKNVAARVQQLPFKDNTFDYIVASYSIPYYLPYDFAEYNRSISEILAVLKPGGKAYFYPINTEQKKLIKKVLSQFANFTTFQFAEDEGGGVSKLMLIKK